MTQIDFSHRNNLPEFMDSEETDFETFRDCLVDLAKVNHLTFAYRPTMWFLKRLARSGRLPCDRTLTIVDVGSGYGDMLRKIDLWAQRYGVKLDLTGVDLNPWSARAAQAATSLDRPIRYVTANVFAYQPAKPIDIVISSLLTHHLDDAALVRFIRWMEGNTTIGWFINDAHRKALPYHVFRIATRLLRFHEFVQHDGPISIARSFHAADWYRLLNKSGVSVPPARIERVFPYRLCVSRFWE
jgi:trans-aconitate methyltransferase